MTTAHRPTFNFAVASGTNPSGNLIVGHSARISNRDAAKMTKLKTREVGQNGIDERASKKQYREELEEREQKAKDEREGKRVEKKDTKLNELPGRLEDLRRQPAEDNPFPEDADDDLNHGSDKESDDDDDDDDDEEETEELMRELAKIKKERQEEEERIKAQQDKQDSRAKREEVFKGNPLLAAATGDLSLKRKWDDDTVFKNQARTAPKPKQRYINDAVRSDFHKKFLNKYVQMDTVYH
eukprot:TRINITY_DN74130_c0_g1_i1.p2 TRINITY_DN74130_c0_g1~~TRINITY_DN74130_c0_g1_i1.p2  ORF type:complete len:240 (+),score=98.84 TRINITY_DN74130_c0_g1_i1:166-885(+)